MPLSPALDELTAAQLKELVAQLLADVAALKQTVAVQREEIARLKGLKGPPDIKPSGMERTTASPPARPGRDKLIRGKVALPRLTCSRRLTHCLTRHAPGQGALGRDDGADQHGDTG